VNDPQQKTLGTPTMIVPSIAYRRPDVYHAGSGDFLPRTDPALYQHYEFLGRVAVNETDDHWDVSARAKQRFGPGARVFRTARWWVVYAVR
jgi:hypothetical protein